MHVREQIKVFTELSNTTTTLNNNNNTPLSNMNIRETILKVMREDEEESITDADNVTVDALSHASSSQR